MQFISTFLLNARSIFFQVQHFHALANTGLRSFKKGFFFYPPPPAPPPPKKKNGNTEIPGHQGHSIFFPRAHSERIQRLQRMELTHTKGYECIYKKQKEPPTRRKSAKRKQFLQIKTAFFIALLMAPTVCSSDSMGK